jgi:hypothetical protein
VSLPRDLVSELMGAPFEDEEAFNRLFGDPTQVMLEVWGDPPQAILVWPASTWAQQRPGERRPSREPN